MKYLERWINQFFGDDLQATEFRSENLIGRIKDYSALEIARSCWVLAIARGWSAEWGQSVSEQRLFEFESDDGCRTLATLRLSKQGWIQSFATGLFVSEERQEVIEELHLVAHLSSGRRMGSEFVIDNTYVKDMPYIVSDQPTETWGMGPGGQHEVFIATIPPEIDPTEDPLPLQSPQFIREELASLSKRHKDTWIISRGEIEDTLPSEGHDWNWPLQDKPLYIAAFDSLLRSTTGSLEVPSRDAFVSRGSLWEWTFGV